MARQLEKKPDGENLPELENPTFDGGGLDALGGLAAGVDAEADGLMNPEAGGVSGGVPIAQGPDYVQEARMTIDFMGAMIDGYVPGAAAHWDDGTRARMAMSLGPVYEKYQFTLGAMPVELTALVICGPVLYQSAKVVGEKLKADKLAAMRAADPRRDPNTVQASQGAAQAGPERAAAAPSSQTAERTLQEALKAPNFGAL